MAVLSAGQCSRCGADVSHFARLCPKCHAPNLSLAPIAIVVCVLVLGGLVTLGANTLRNRKAPAAVPVEAAAPAPKPAVRPKDDYGWIVQAMADCDEEAKQRFETLHFLIVPVTATETALPGWSPNPISAVGGSAVLLNSSDTLIGLRNDALTLYPKPLTFLVSDPTTDTIYKWKPATGVASLKRRGTDAAKLKLGFEIPDVAKEVEWGPLINLTKGTCYWINPLIRTAARGG
jgi:hypothetical protein